MSSFRPVVPPATHYRIFVFAGAGLLLLGQAMVVYFLVRGKIEPVEVPILSATFAGGTLPLFLIGELLRRHRKMRQERARQYDAALASTSSPSER